MIFSDYNMINDRLTLMPEKYGFVVLDIYFYSFCQEFAEMSFCRIKFLYHKRLLKCFSGNCPKSKYINLYPLRCSCLFAMFICLTFYIRGQIPAYSCLLKPSFNILLLYFIHYCCFLQQKLGSFLHFLLVYKESGQYIIYICCFRFLTFLRCRSLFLSLWFSNFLASGTLSLHS